MEDRWVKILPKRGTNEAPRTLYVSKNFQKKNKKYLLQLLLINQSNSKYCYSKKKLACKFLRGLDAVFLGRCKQSFKKLNQIFCVVCKSKYLGFTQITRTQKFHFSYVVIVKQKYSLWVIIRSKSTIKTLF